MDDMLTETIYFFECANEKPAQFFSSKPKREVPGAMHWVWARASKNLKIWMGKDG